MKACKCNVRYTYAHYVFVLFNTQIETENNCIRKQTKTEETTTIYLYKHSSAWIRGD